RVVDRVHPDGLRADLCAQRVDECLARGPDARRLGGAAGEDHLGIGAPRGVPEWDWGYRYHEGCHCRRADQFSEVAWPHAPMLTHCAAERASSQRPRIIDHGADELRLRHKRPPRLATVSTMSRDSRQVLRET